MKLEDITPVVLTYNEEQNVGRSLQRLRRFPDVVVVDSGSTDSTAEMVARYANARLVDRDFDSHARQWNYGLDQARTDWVLSLDADYIVSNAFVSELEGVDQREPFVGYRASFSYVIFGRPLQRSILPPRIVLFRKSACHYADDGHTQRLIVGGDSGVLTVPILHDDRKPLDRWLGAQNRYAKLEVAKLRGGSRLGWADRVRRAKLVAPIAVFFYVAITGRLRDGWRGWYYAYQRMIAEAVLSLELIEAEFVEGDSTQGGGISIESDGGGNA